MRRTQLQHHERPSGHCIYMLGRVYLKVTGRATTSVNTTMAPPKPTVTVNPLPQYPNIIIALKLLNTSPPRFHWLLWIADAAAAESDVQSGVKFHAIDNGIRVWSYERAPHILASSHSLATAAIIGQLKGKNTEDLDVILREIPMAVPAVDQGREAEWSCRVWVREALRRMHTHGFILCPDVDAMEEEMWGYGRQAAADIEAGDFSIATLHVARNSCTA